MYEEIILILFSALITGLFVFMFFILRRLLTGSKQYIAKFLRMEGDRYVKTGQMKFSLEDKLIRYKDKSFPFDTKILGYVEKNKTFIFFDINNNKQLSFKEVGSSINVKLIDQLLESDIIGKLVSRLNSLQRQSYILVIMAAFVGAAVGYFIGQYFAPVHTVIQYVNSTNGIPSV